MARPIDPTSQLQVEKRARWLRSEESGWTQSLALAIAMAALKAWQWSHYLENGGEPGPLAGTFPRLPEDQGSWVIVGAAKAPDPDLGTPHEGESTRGGHPDRTFWGFSPDAPGEDPRRLHLLRGDQWLVDGQAEGCEAPDTEQLAMALELATLLQEKHLHLLLRPAFYKEVARWIGELLKAPRPEIYVPPEPGACAFWMDPKSREFLGTAETVDGVVLLRGAPGSPWPGDLWRVPAAPLGIPSEEALHRHGISAEELALCAACWYFGREAYRKLLDPRANALGQRGLERPALLRQLLEELEVVSPRGLPVRSVAEKPVASMASHEVAALGLRAFPRPDKWTAAEDGRGRFLHKRQGRQWQVTMATGAGEELAFKSLAQCRKLLTYRNTGLEITSLHALLCCYVMQCREPGSRFVVSGDDLLRDLGLEARRYGGLTRSDLLKELGKWASLLGLAQCEGWSRPRNGERISMELGPMWSISIHANGQLQLLENDPRPDTLTDLALTVTPGTWAETPQWANREASGLLYAPIATEILQLGRHRRELAFRLGIHLALAFRERPQLRGGKGNLRVGQLLEEVLPQETLDRARGNRDEASRLRSHWGAALGTLRDHVGFRFEFPDCPGWLIPPDFPGHEDATAPHGALELLLNSRVEIHWPEKVVEARLQKPLAQIQERETQKLIRQTQARLLNPRPTDNAAQLKAAIEATGLTQRAVAPRLGISKGYLGQLVTGKKPLTREKLGAYLRLLETLRNGAKKER